METLRTSSYIIPVKLESEEGKYMLIHGYTGAMDIVSESVVLCLKYNEIKKLSDLTLQALQRRGYITNKTKEEEIEYVERVAQALHKRDEILHKSFTWVVTYNCNFRCPYCFEKREYKDSPHRIVLTKSQVDRLFNAMIEIEPRKQLQDSVITLYGGEPLLKENKEIVTYIVQEGRKRGYKFHAITNGYDLDSYLSLLAPNLITLLQITIDGTKKNHNQKRKHFEDSNSFDEKVIIHDGVRPMVTVELIEECLKNVGEYDGCMPVLPLNDTIYYSDNGEEITSLMDRSKLYAGQAPEAFNLYKYYDINENTSEEELNRIKGTSELAYKKGLNIKLIAGEDTNFKITTRADLTRFEMIVKENNI